MYGYLWLIHVDVWQKPTQYCKAMILPLKINTFFLKKKAMHSLSPQSLLELMSPEIHPNMVCREQTSSQVQ